MVQLKLTQSVSRCLLARVSRITGNWRKARFYNMAEKQENWDNCPKSPANVPFHLRKEEAEEEGAGKKKGTG